MKRRLLRVVKSPRFWKLATAAVTAIGTTVGAALAQQVQQQLRAKEITTRMWVRAADLADRHESAEALALAEARACLGWAHDTIAGQACLDVLVHRLEVSR